MRVLILRMWRTIKNYLALFNLLPRTDINKDIVLKVNGTIIDTLQYEIIQDEDAQLYININLYIPALHDADKNTSINISDDIVSYIKQTYGYNPLMISVNCYSDSELHFGKYGDLHAFSEALREYFRNHRIYVG